MKAESVDLIFADPPYNLGKDFGNKSDSWKDRSQYLDWCYEWIDACFRVKKGWDMLFNEFNAEYPVYFYKDELENKVESL